MWQLSFEAAHDNIKCNNHPAILAPPPIPPRLLSREGQQKQLEGNGMR
jgi:hypothetical protein